MIRALLICSMALTACGPLARRPHGPDRAAAMAAIERVLANDRRAHLETDAGLLAASIADTLVSFDAGTVRAQPRDSVRAMFERYFAGARYHAWEDIQRPRISFANDNSLAWVSRVVCVDRDEPDSAGGRRRRVFVSAYVGNYVWRSGGWRMTTVSSTFSPHPPARCPSSKD